MHKIIGKLVGLAVSILVSLGVVIGVPRFGFLLPSAQAVSGTLNLQGSIASFSGQTTFGQNLPLRPAAGPLRLQYKSDLDTYSDGLILREGDGNVVVGSNVTPTDIAASKLSVMGTINGDKFQDAQNSAYFFDPAATGTSLTTAGNVGIGTTGPGAVLDVESVSTTNMAKFYGTGGSAQVQIGNNGYLVSGSSKFQIYGASGIPLSLGSGGADEKVYITTAGNVGIGTTGPGAKLEISDSSPFLRLTSTTGVGLVEFYKGAVRSGYFGYGTDTNLYLKNEANGYTTFFNNNTELMRLSSTGGLSLGSSYVGTDPGAGSMIISGNVGIGTTGPGAKIHSLATTEQLRLGYDTSNYNSFTVGSTGNLNIASVGSNPNIILTPGTKTVTTTETFSSNTSWTVPVGVTSITVKAWGSGGGSNNGTNQTGGGGGFAQADISVTAGESLLIRVGGGGIKTGAGGTNGGGAGGVGTSYTGAGGGGYTGVFRTSVTQGNALIMAGGGGGVGGGGAGVYGGAGGGTSGTASNSGSPGGGGTQSAGGAGGGAGAAGSALTGGAGAPAGDVYGGGGGGSGYYGGGGGGSGGGGAGGGGGGSGYVTGTNTTLTAGSNGTVANSGDADYLTGKGNGGNNANGQDGYMVIKYTGDSAKVGIGTTTPSTALHVVGTITGTTKNFEIAHPTKSGMRLVHSTLEGPEVAVFYRDEARLVNGKAVVKLPDYFEALTRKEGRTVQLTAKNGWSPLYVDGDVKNGKFTVKADSGKPDQQFYWEVKAVRADVEPLVVEKSVK